MLKNNAFTIYNASAGSGKTFTLVKEYLKILLKSDNPLKFKHILAITFTNKAVAEMKARIIETLKQFSNKQILTHPNSMFNVICDELQMAPSEIHGKSKNILDTIVFNYAAFDVSTIDGFTHKIIRTFAHDLKLPMNFEVELEQETLLNEAVDSLIARAGTDDSLTNTLVDFAIEKADDDKSWDIALDFNKIAKLLVSENDVPYIQALADKTLDDFKALKAQLKKDIIGTENAIKKHGKSVLTLIEEAGLEHKDFSYGTLPNHFKKIAKLDLDKLYENNLEENITERKKIYPKKLDTALANTIEEILPEIEVTYKQVKSLVYHYKFLKNFHKNITPLSVLSAINKELSLIKQEQNKMLISEFNIIISNEIKDQPTPFIYERIGEKFRHYFIDEFQDTSEKQWENLIPLIDNSLSSEHGSAMIVGDAKQAIYRWRGGKAEQFIGLFNKDNPFNIEKTLENLPTNYRSFKEIINFNNSFFKYLSHQVFSNKAYEELYEKGGQNSFLEDSGYVEISFLDIEKTNDINEQYCKAVLNKINTCLEAGFSLKDLCVLVRKKKEGVAVAHYLSEHQIPIVSSETLLISSSSEVNFLTDFLKLLIQPENNEIKVSVLNFLASLFKVNDKHNFFIEHLNLSLAQLFKSFQIYNIYISENIVQIPLYDLVETIVRSFNLIETSNAYIQFFLDFVLEFSQKKGSDISAFLKHFEKKKDNLSIVSPKSLNAVQIMTIHKSKGLEFPVVIFPYADLDIYKEQEPKAWYQLNEEQYQGFSHTLLNYNKDFEYYGEIGSDIFKKHQSELELDNINLLYVVLTRAIEQLFVISKIDVSSKGEVNSKKYSGLFINYLKHIGKWEASKNLYSFGSLEKTSEEEMMEDQMHINNDFISTPKESHNIKVVTKSAFLWDTKQQKAIEKGNLVHNIMALVKSKDDIDFVINKFFDESLINQSQLDNLKDTVLQIVNHPLLKEYYNSNQTVFNERDIITVDGEIHRPDRININSNNEAVIIDYKTGKEDKKHIQQLEVYQNILEKMQYTVKKKLLVYTNDNIFVKLVK
ncbi:UvrD-helicase domain-containing protein [Seonamhaeicola aphaedonensis]|uniref:DNA 3'-5' helicase n=1 Tax=Seonamhaeicola aphaedonensis TaxID=1461338 RepID=A0A3D9HGX3_9FLAO|nr:UvrD-helicase domain-containing protein [Seonamhaeicola aphaedonensis]RED48720.1 ATP-dependent exoDNAse (exonuclease V) beta subunit [Seonamhaeicola aphaedonensis]